MNIPLTEGTRAPMQDRSRRTLQRILESGAEVFAEGGYDGLSIAEVCSRAGVSAGSLYTRFEGKDALVRAIHDHVLRELTAEVTALYASTPGWDALPTDLFIERGVRVLIDHFRTHAAIIRSIVLRSAVDPAMRSRGAEAVRSMSDAFTARLLSRDGEFAAPDAEAAIRSTFALVFESTSWDVTFGSEFRATGALGPDDGDERIVTICRLMLVTSV